MINLEQRETTTDLYIYGIQEIEKTLNSIVIVFIVHHIKLQKDGSRL